MIKRFVTVSVLGFVCLFHTPALTAETPYIGRHGVNFSTGNKYLVEPEVSISDPTGLFSFTRNYNSQSTQESVFGYGWSFTGLESLEITLDIGLITRYRGDGQKSLFWADENDPAPREWINPVGEQTSIIALPEGGYQLRLSKGDIRQFDSEGRISMTRDLSGRETHYTWNNSGFLVAISGPFGRQVELRYNNDGLVQQLSTALGDFTYSYDEHRNLLSVTRPDNTTRGYLYEDANDVHNLTGVIDQTGKRVQTIEYDSNDRVVSSAFAGGLEKITIAYQDNYTRSITNSLGEVSTYQLESLHGVSRVTSSSGPTCAMACGGASGSISTSYTYNFNQQVESQTDGRGIVTRYGYDDQGRIISEIRAAGTALERVIQTSWTETGLPASITEPSLAAGKHKITSYTYDSGGRVLTESVSGWRGETAISATTTYSYDSLGRPLSIDGPRTDVNDITTLSWYPDEVSQGNNRGQLYKIINALGYEISYSNYLPNGRPGSIVDANGLQTTLTYNLAGQLLSSESAGLITSYTWDAAGRLLSMNLPGGKRIEYIYNEADLVESVSDQAGNSVVFAYDTEGRMVSRELRGPDQAVSAQLGMAYDAYGRLSQLILPEGGAESYSYDANGKLLTRVNALNQTSTFTYDSLGRPITSKNPAGEQAVYGYDPQDNQTSVTDSRGLLTSYSYDDLGNQMRVVSPDTGTTVSDYDAAGNLMSSTDATGQTNTYSYDMLNRLSSVNYGGGRTVQFHYDQGAYGIGRLTGVTDNGGQIQFRYDIFGRLIEETSQVNGKTFRVGYAWDDNGDFSAITYPSGRTITYQRDVDGRVTGLVSSRDNSPLALAESISYAPLGPIKEITLGNGVRIQAGYDQQYRLSSLQAGTVLQRRYDYTRLGQVATITDELVGARSQSFVYDLAGRLSEARGGYGVFAYTYDSNGNRLGKTENTNTINYQYGTNNNRLLSVGNGLDLTYDAKGNLLSDGTRSFVWDKDNRLSVISESNAALGRYSYDFFGLRRSAIRDDQNSLFVYDGDGKLLAESDGNGNIIREYVYLDSQRLAMFDLMNSDAVFYYVNDHLGTAQILLDDQAAIVWQGNYKPFGEVDVVVNNLANHFRFPGQIFDSESGLHYNWNRYYNPQTGRYISADPIGLDGGLNLYVYVGGDPINYRDMEALKRIWAMKKYGGGLGFLFLGLSVYKVEFVSNCEYGEKIIKNYLLISPALTVGAKVSATWGDSENYFGGTTYMKNEPDPRYGFSASGPSGGFIAGSIFMSGATDFNSFGTGNLYTKQNMIGASIFNAEGHGYIQLDDKIECCE